MVVVFKGSVVLIAVEDRPKKREARTTQGDKDVVDETDATEEQPTVIKKEAGDKKEKTKEVDEEKDQHQPPDVSITPIASRPMTSDILPPQLSSAKVSLISLKIKAERG